VVDDLVLVKDRMRKCPDERSDLDPDNQVIVEGRGVLDRDKFRVVDRRDAVLSRPTVSYLIFGNEPFIRRDSLNGFLVAVWQKHKHHDE
jgi:hypothetical protein